MSYRRIHGIPVWGTPLDNAVDQIVTWNGNGDLAAAGETVAIRLRLFQAKVFAYHV